MTIVGPLPWGSSGHEKRKNPMSESIASTRRFRRRSMSERQIPMRRSLALGVLSVCSMISVVAAQELTIPRLAKAPALDGALRRANGTPRRG